MWFIEVLKFCWSNKYKGMTYLGIVMANAKYTDSKVDILVADDAKYRLEHKEKGDIILSALNSTLKNVDANVRDIRGSVRRTEGRVDYLYQGELEDSKKKRR